MAVRFTNDSTQQYSAGTGLPTSTTFTAACWVYLASSLATYSTIWAFGDATGYPNARTEFTTDSDGTTLTVVDSVVNFVGSFATSTGAWYKTAVVVSGTTATLYVGAAGASLSSSSGAFTPHSTPNFLSIGSNAGQYQSYNGALASFKMWQAVLTQTELDAEFGSWTAVRTANLLRVHKLQVPETTDYSGNGNTLTAGSGAAGLTTAADPPIPPTGPYARPNVLLSGRSLF